MSTNARPVAPVEGVEAISEGLLALEPMKVEGGSPERQAWLGLVMDVQLYLLQRDRRLGERFMEAMLA